MRKLYYLHGDLDGQQCSLSYSVALLPLYDFGLKTGLEKIICLVQRL